MVAAAGLEPTAHSLGNCCSILMSYAATKIFDTRECCIFQDLFFVIDIGLAP